MTDQKTIKDRLREQYFELLPDIRRVTEHLEAVVRYSVLPIVNKLDPIPGLDQGDQPRASKYYGYCPYASTARYPGEDLEVHEAEARRAVEIAERVRETVRRSLREEGFENAEVNDHRQRDLLPAVGSGLARPTALEKTVSKIRVSAGLTD